MRKSVLLDLANETVRRYRDVEPEFAKKMSNRIRRKFSIIVETPEICEFVIHYKEIYNFAKSIFKEYLNPPDGKYADLKDVDTENFLDKLTKKFPDDDKDILEKISGWVIYYEYLR